MARCKRLREIVDPQVRTVSFNTKEKYSPSCVRFRSVVSGYRPESLAPSGLRPIIHVIKYLFLCQNNKILELIVPTYYLFLTLSNLCLGNRTLLLMNILLISSILCCSCLRMHKFCDCVFVSVAMHEVPVLYLEPHIVDDSIVNKEIND